MKNYSLLALLFLLVGCSADNEELLPPENEVKVLDLQAASFSSTAESTTNNICGTGTFPFGEYGDLNITHDGTNVYVTITAREGYDLVDIKLDLVSGEESFPLVGNGNLPPGKMEYKFSFKSGQKSFTFPPFNFTSDLFGTYISIASKTTFTNGLNTFSSWTGPLKGSSGNWNYLQYRIETCCDMANAGEDFTRVMYQATYESSYGNGARLRRYLLGQILLEDPSASESGIFIPPAGFLDRTYNDWSGQGGSDDDLPWSTDGQGRLVLETTYTVGEGSCVDEAKITLYIDPNNPS